MAYEMRISDWRSDLCLPISQRQPGRTAVHHATERRPVAFAKGGDAQQFPECVARHTFPSMTNVVREPLNRSVFVIPAKAGIHCKQQHGPQLDRKSVV